MVAYGTARSSIVGVWRRLVAILRDSTIDQQTSLYDIKKLILALLDKLNIWKKILLF